VVVVEVVVVLVDVVVEPASVVVVDVVVEPARVVVVVVVVLPSVCRSTVPARLAAPGPGSDVAPSTSTLPVAGMQNFEASDTAAGVSCVSGPAGMPVSEYERHAVLPKQPWLLFELVCPGQKSPFALLALAVPVTTGVRSTARLPRSALPSEPPGWQSFESPPEFVDVQLMPARAPRSQLPVAGAAGEPAAEQRGQGWPAFPVTKMCEESETLDDRSPVEVSSVPLAGAAKLLTTQVERPPFGIGSGGPKAQAVVVQSMPVGALALAPTVQLEPVQPLTMNRLVAPSGTGPSGTLDPPPPRSSAPQPRFFINAFEPSCVEPQAPVPAAVVKSSTTVPGAAVVVVVLVVVVVVVGPAVVVVVGTVVVVVVVVVVAPAIVVVVVVVTWVSRTVPGRLSAPGPGSDAAPSIRRLPVAGTQNVVASVAVAGTPGDIGPAGTPTSRISSHDELFGFVKQPAAACDGQNMPVALAISDVPVARGERFTGMSPTKIEHTPPGHCEFEVHAPPLFEPL
jgi:hypothetical protein